MTVGASDTVDTAVELLVASKLHRVYVLDDAERPISVVSITDVLRLLVGTDAASSGDRP